MLRLEPWSLANGKSLSNFGILSSLSHTRRKKNCQKGEIRKLIRMNKARLSKKSAR